MALKKMKKENINILRKIDQINNYLFANTDSWFDFQFSIIQDGLVRLNGGFDLTTYPGTFDIIEIEFKEAIFIKAILFGWQLQKEKPFIEISTKDESLEELSKLQEQGKICYLNDGYHAFKINTDRGEPVMIIAKSIKFSIKKADR